MVAADVQGKRLSGLNAIGRHALFAGIAAIGGLTATPVMAQDSDTRIVQIPTGAREAPVEQLSADRSDAAVWQDGPTTDTAASQIGTRSESRATGSQLTRELPGGRAPQQLYTGGRTAQPSNALSSPSEGRTGAVARVTGNDRCDRPQTDSAVVRACARVIESRSGEFAAAEAPVLSPEQRLLVDQNLREGPSTARVAARRLADDGDVDSLEAQSVASVAQRQASAGVRPGPIDDPAQSALSAETQAFVNALVTTITNAPPPTPR